MPQTPQGSQSISLTTFGGLVTYQDPTSLPQGVSPDCGDVAFLPGGLFQRPSFKKALATALGVCTVTYAKSYVDPTGVIRNLYLDSLGNLWMENITTAAAPVVIATTTPGSYAKSVTAFGREYIAISDGLHGQEVPLQYDGTNLDRVTQDGPGAPPTVASLALPPVAMASAGSPIVLVVVECDPEGPDGSGYFTSINLYTSSAITDVAVGDPITVAGNTEINGGPFTVLAIYPGTPNSLIVLSAYLDPGTTFGTGGTATIPGATATRQENVVTITTATPHQLQVGFQEQMTGVPPEVVGGHIVSIVIDNEDFPGVATVTTNTPHGLVPESSVSITGVLPATVAGTVAADLQGQVLTLTFSVAHGLVPGAVVTLHFTGSAELDGTTVTVLGVPSPTTLIATLADADTTASGGSVSLAWPIPDGPTPQYFEVVSAPTPTTFQVPIDYCDGAWGAGTGQLVSFAWDGTFYVTSISNPFTLGGTDYLTFTYQQYGPNGTTSVAGTITPFGQAAPGLHQLQVLFLTRQGAITAPSPPVTFEANGGQYPSVTNIPTGPANVVARILAFTLADGAYFFYIPSTPQVNGTIVGTPTQINDNTTTSALLDFGDTTLAASLAISIPGNNLANQVVIDSALGFGSYGSRLITYGQRNTIQNLLNLGFDGGFFPNAPLMPTGWSDDGSTQKGALAPGHYGQAWEIPVVPASPCGAISQSAYEDYSGAPIIQANTQYKARIWLKVSAVAADVKFFVILTSLSAAFSVTTEFDGSTMSAVGSWLEAPFSGKTPATIPRDLLLQIYAESTASSVTLLIDEMSLIYSQTPYLNGLYGSYVDNPEALDGVTGVCGPVDDVRQVMDLTILRANLYLLTRDPTGRLHETNDAPGEPADWIIDEIAANCGAVSAFSLTRSQAGDDSASGGEEWFAWYSSTGIRGFAGRDPDKISQEIQRPAGTMFPGAPDDLGAINPAAMLTVWGLNDPGQKIMWFGIPSGAATAPSRIFYLSYLGMDSWSEIAAGSPVHQSITGRITARDLNRKWAPWNRPMNGAALMYRDVNTIQPVFFGGTGLVPGAAGFGNVYTLGSSGVDDNYGSMAPYYVTYALPARDEEQALQLGMGMKLVTYSSWFIPSGVGVVTPTILWNSLSNAWPNNGVAFPMAANALFDMEWTGNQATAQRFFVKLSFAPAVAGGPVQFQLATLSVALRQNKRGVVRGTFP
jgi:hypothetical protein